MNLRTHVDLHVVLCFIAPCQFTQLLNLRSLIFDIRPWPSAHLTLPDSTKLTAQNKAARLRAACQVRESPFMQTTWFVCLPLLNSLFVLSTKVRMRHPDEEEKNLIRRRIIAALTLGAVVCVCGPWLLE